MPTRKQLSIIRESEMEFPETRRPDDPLYKNPSDQNKNKSEEKKITPIIKTHTFYTHPITGILMLVEIILKEGPAKHMILRRNYFSDEELEAQKEDLEGLVQLSEKFSSEIKETKILDENIEIRVENKNVKIFKNYSENNTGSIVDERNVDVVKRILETSFTEYVIEIIRNPEKEYSISANNVL